MRLRARFGSREFSASPWFLLLAAVGVLLFTRLGSWQWHRAAEKERIAAAFVRGDAAATPLGSRLLATVPRYTRLLVEGSYEPAHQFLLDNLSRDAQAGFEVLTPFRLADGRIVLVNRGWIPLPADGNRARLPDVAFAAPAGPVTIEVRVDNLPVTGLAMGRAAPSGDTWPKLTSFPTSAELATALGRPVEDGELLLAASQPLGFRRDWQPASNGFPPERHRAYAIQWWGLAALAAVLFVFMNLRKRPE